MKKLSIMAIIASTMALTACGGGDSSSSGSTYTTTTATSSTGTTTATIPACTVSGTNITGTKGTSCTYSIANLNGGATQTLVCNASSGGSTNGISFGTSFTLNGMVLSCN